MKEVKTPKLRELKRSESKEQQRAFNRLNASEKSMLKSMEKEVLDAATEVGLYTMNSESLLRMLKRICGAKQNKLIVYQKELGKKYNIHNTENITSFNKEERNGSIRNSGGSGIVGKRDSELVQPEEKG